MGGVPLASWFNRLRNGLAPQKSSRCLSPHWVQNSDRMTFPQAGTLSAKAGVMLNRWTTGPIDPMAQTEQPKLGRKPRGEPHTMQSIES